MIPKIYREMLSKLVRRTGLSEVNWKPTTHEDRFVVDLKEYSISVAERWDKDAQIHYISFFLLDSGGNVIDRFKVFPGEELWEASVDLHETARREAHDVDDAIGKISKELDGEGKIGVDDLEHIFDD